MMLQLFFFLNPWWDKADQLPCSLDFCIGLLFIQPPFKSAFLSNISPLPGLRKKTLDHLVPYWWYLQPRAILFLLAFSHTMFWLLEVFWRKIQTYERYHFIPSSVTPWEHSVSYRRNCHSKQVVINILKYVHLNIINSTSVLATPSRIVSMQKHESHRWNRHILWSRLYFKWNNFTEIFRRHQGDSRNNCFSII